MAVDCTADALAEASACFNVGYDRFMLQAMRIVAWCNFLNGDTMECSPESMAEAANCLVASLTAGQLDAAETYLACAIANSGGGGGGSDQIKIYVNDPNTEGIVPGDQTKGAVAYSGAGKPTYNWDTAQLLWI